MSPELIIKISNDSKLHNYLINNSYWYKLLNRDKNNYKIFYQSYKSNNREEKVNKVNKALNTLDTVNTIFKIIN